MESVREAVVVIVSILVAFSLDAWWDGRTQQDDTRLLLEALDTDFGANAVEVDRWIRLHERALNSATSLLLLAGEVEEGQRIEVSDTLLASAQFSPTYEPIVGTLQLAIASGGLGEIENPRLKRLLVQWTAVVEDTRADEMSARSLMRESLIPLLRSESDLESVFRAASDRTVGEEGTSLSYTPSSISSTTSIRSGSAVRAILAQRNLSSQMALRGLARVSAIQDSILAEISVELQRLN